MSTSLLRTSSSIELPAVQSIQDNALFNTETNDISIPSPTAPIHCKTTGTKSKANSKGVPKKLNSFSEDTILKKHYPQNTIKVTKQRNDTRRKLASNHQSINTSKYGLVHDNESSHHSIGRMSPNSLEDDFDDGLLRHVVQDAGQWAYGTVMVEVWAMNKYKTHLVRAQGGCWVDPRFVDTGHHRIQHQQHPHQHDEDYDNNFYDEFAKFDAHLPACECHICRLVHTSSPYYVPVDPVCDGVGLPGVLWSEISKKRNRRITMSSSANAATESHRSTRASTASTSRFQDWLAGFSSHHNSKLERDSLYANTIYDDSDESNNETFQDEDSDASFQCYSKQSNSDRRFDGKSYAFVESPGHSSFGESYPSHPVVWGEVHPMAQDPHQAYDERVKLFADCGIGLAAAVPFDNDDGMEGIVIFMTKQGIDPDKLKSTSNERYLISATNLIGSAYSLRRPRHEAMQERRQEFQDTLQQAKAKIVAAIELASAMQKSDKNKCENKDKGKGKDATLCPSNVKDIDKEISLRIHHIVDTKNINQAIVSNCWDYSLPHDDDLHSCTYQICKKIQLLSKKFRGSAVKPPPPSTFRHSLLAFVGTFTTLAVLSELNQYLTSSHGQAHAIAIGPFGAFLTLVFGLTAAPAAQPLNTMTGQMLAMLIALGFSKLSILDDPMKQTLAASLSIFAMIKLGVTHPPAGASALVFATGQYGWMSMVTTLLGYLVAIIIATLVNNIADDRQYPTFWGIGFVWDMIIKFFHRFWLGRYFLLPTSNRKTKSRSDSQRISFLFSSSSIRQRPPPLRKKDQQQQNSYHLEGKKNPTTCTEEPTCFV